MSCLDSHSDGTHSLDPLVSKWCNDTFLQICSDEETDSSTFWMAWGWVHNNSVNYTFKIETYSLELLIVYVLIIWRCKIHKYNN